MIAELAKDTSKKGKEKSRKCMRTHPPRVRTGSLRLADPPITGLTDPADWDDWLFGLERLL